MFHSTGLNLSDAIVSSDGFKTSQAPASQSFEEKSERAILDFSSPFAKGTKLQLKVKFDADLTGNMMGYYYSSWEKDGQKQYYTLTQFEVRQSRYTTNANVISLRYIAHCSPPCLPLLG